MKKLILTIIIFLISISFVSAITEPTEETMCEYFISGLNLVQGMQIPSVIPYQNDAFGLYDFNNNPIGRLHIEKGQITTIDCEPAVEPDFMLKIKDKQTLTTIFEAENMLDEFNNQLGNNIIIEGTSFGKNVKGFFVRIGLKLAGFFS